MENIQQTVTSILKTTKSDSFDFDGHLGKAIDKKLREEGFKSYQSGSYCTKASFESNIKKEGKRVEIIEANFMGKFTQIKVYVNYT